MTSLTDADSLSVLEFLSLLYTPCRLDDFPMQVLTALPKLVSGDIFAAVSFGDFKIALPCSYTFPNPWGGEVAEAVFMHPQHFLAHPNLSFYLQTLDGQALAMSDFFSEAEFHRQEVLYAGMFRQN
jgi:hypothetical protein